jgi:hypothetical protein
VYLVQVVPHLGYHVRNSAPGLSDSENLQSVMSLVVGAALPIVLLWGNRTAAEAASATGRVAAGAPAGR